MDNTQVQIDPSAQHADILSALHSAQALSSVGLYDVLCQLLLGNTSRVCLIHAPTSFVSLADVCTRIKRSPAWVWKNIVADSDDDKQKKKRPPHPYDWLPQRAIPGKGLWVASEFELWMQEVIARGRQATHNTATNCKTPCEVRP